MSSEIAISLNITSYLQKGNSTERRPHTHTHTQIKKHGNTKIVKQKGSLLIKFTQK